MLLRHWTLILILVLMGAAATAGEIHRAAEAGDLDRVKALVRADADVVHQLDDNRDQSLPLHTAAVAGHADIVEYLIDKGAVVDGYDVDESTPLMVACLRGKAEAAKVLLRHGASVGHTDLNGATPVTFAMNSGNAQVIEALLDNGIDLSADDPNSSTYMIAAAAAGSLDMMQRLQSSGVSVNTTTAGGSTPLIAAARGGHTEALKWLIDQGAETGHVDENGMGALIFNAFRGNAETIALLAEAGVDLNNQDRFGRTALNCAARSGNEAVVNALLKAGADPNVATEVGMTALIRSVERGSLAQVTALLAAGAEVTSVETVQGRQALHIAAARGYGDIASALVKAGAPLSVADNADATPLALAAVHGNRKIAKSLKKAGAGASGVTNACQLAGTVKACDKPCSGTLKTVVRPDRGDARVWYLGHSAMAVQTRNNLLIFDYFENGRAADAPCLANGNICADEIAGLDVTVFASHAHGDHFDPVIFEWREKVKDITYVLGFEPEDEAVPAHESIGARETKTFGDVTVHTIASNDSGVGFMVDVDGVTIFHAGDHANRERDLSGNYCPEIDYLVAAGHHPDITMLPTTGCNFGDQVAVRTGIDYTLEKFGATTFFPMHAGSNPARYTEVWDEIGAKHTRVEAVIPRDNGDLYEYVARDGHASN